MVSKFCSHCGEGLVDGAKFCGKCGAPVLAQPSSEETLTPPPATETFAESPAVQEAPAPEPAVPEEPIQEPAALEEPVQEPEAPEEPVQEPEASEEPVPAETEILPQAAVSDNTPVQEAVPVPSPKKRRTWQRRGAMRTIAAVLLCIFIFVLSFTTMALWGFRELTTGAQRENAVHTVLQSTDVTKLPASTFIANLDDKSISLGDWIISVAAEFEPEFEEASRSDIREYWEESALTEYLAKSLSENLNGIYTGKNIAPLSEAELAELLKEDSRTFRKAFGIELTDEQIVAIAEKVNTIGLLKTSGATLVKSQSPAVYCSLQILASVWLLVALGLFLLREILILQKANRSILRTCGDLGVTLMVMSVLWIVVGLISLLWPGVINAITVSALPVGAAIAEMAVTCLLPSAVVFVLSFGLLLIKILGKKHIMKSEPVQI